MLPHVAQIHAGGGRIVLSQHSGNAIFSELSSTYPLKLLSPRVQQKCVAVVYALTYGGGLVGGDQVHLSAEINQAAILLLLTQGSTKVFKSRAEQRLASVKRLFEFPNDNPPATTSSIGFTSPNTIQKMDFKVSPNAVLVLLPDPVTCFRSASYSQIQTFHLAKDASVVVLDWITSGRRSRGEEWVFSRYSSVNEIVVDGKRIARDVLLLETEEGKDDVRMGSSTQQRTLADRLSPYACYATVLLSGPAIQTLAEGLRERYGKMTVMKATTPTELLWSLSSICSDSDGLGMIVRVAGKDTELVKEWLRDALSSLADVVGIDVYRRAFV
ncbi:UreD-domain-containing protein [Dendrothele bispora CBS 962.96]|uniref:UreD-domain-containing protein n=1 Tax=Dendrothele bispora (strain CBS 962.96) TaxID=1314807 RepID=A0A4S8MWE9_DENBC|nr:UreD-domain-containing protein [Dendrothele bispora CBS 962.96]